MAEFHDMNGLWSGQYSYAIGGAVKFTLWLVDAEGGLSGTTLEPNTFAPTDAEELEATVSGLRSGLSFEFHKFYSGAFGASQPRLIYQGHCDAGFTSATGKWRFDPDLSISGTFRMSRLSAARAKAVTRRIAEPVGRR